MRRAAAHFWTVWPLLKSKLEPPPIPPDEPFAITVEDPLVGPVEVNGCLHRAAVPTGGAGATTGRPPLVILVHGLGGCVDSRYMRQTAMLAHQMGFATLRLNQRGSDRGGADLYHAGLTADLEAVLASPALAEFERVAVLGFSLGGHVTLKLATETAAPRLRAVAAVCSPLDLARTVDAFDRPQTWLYRRYVLRHLAEIYAAVVARRVLPTPLERVRAARKLREWDSLTVVPRFGFADVEDYYARSSVGPRLGELRVPALLIASEDDPMVDRDGIRPALGGAPEHLEVRWVERGGHVGFPSNLDLGFGPRHGLVGQIFGWLGSQLATP